MVSRGVWVLGVESVELFAPAFGEVLKGFKGPVSFLRGAEPLDVVEDAFLAKDGAFSLSASYSSSPSMSTASQSTLAGPGVRRDPDWNGSSSGMEGRMLLPFGRESGAHRCGRDDFLDLGGAMELMVQLLG